MCPCMRANIAAILHAAPRAPPVEPGLTDKLAGHMVRMPMGRLGRFPRKPSAGTIQMEKRRTVWRACLCEENEDPEASTGGKPNGAAGP